MNSKISRCFFVALLSFGNLTFAQKITDSKSNLEKIGAGLTTTMLICPGRIWPNYDWRLYNVLLKDPHQSTVVWSGKTGKLMPLEENQIPSGAFNNLFDIVKFNGKKALSISISDGQYKADPLSYFFRLAIHEGFHQIAQSDWASNPNVPRGTLYPILVGPRIYRRMIFERLVSYYLSDGESESDFAKAAYWFFKWKTEFPEEYKNYTDTREGSAKYVEKIADIVRESGCEISEEALHSKIKTAIRQELTPYMESIRIDTEGYALGSLAAFNLRFIFKDLHWQEALKKGASPLEVLFNNYPAMEDRIPIEIQNQYIKNVYEKNQEIGSWLDDEINLLDSKDTIRLAFTESSNHNTYTTKGHFILRNRPEVSLIPLASHLTVADDDWQILVAKDKVWFALSESPCSNSKNVFIVPVNAVTVFKNEVKIHGGGLEGSMPGVLKTDTHGLRWLCQISR